jgi:crotonobetaine/carnitine-CoA ligase
MLQRDLILPHLIAKRAEEAPDREFLGILDGPVMTRRQTHERILTWADGLRRLGVKPGQNVVTMLPAIPEAHVVWLAVAWLGAVEAPINTAYKGRILSYVINNSGADTMVVSERYLPNILAVAPELEQLKTIVVWDGAADEAISSLKIVAGEAFLRGCGPATDLKGPEHYDIACMIYTSGTTGPSKGVLVPWAQLYRYSVPDPGVFDEWLAPPAQNATALTFLPTYHIGGKSPIYGAAAGERRLLMRQGFSASSYWDEVRKYNLQIIGSFGPVMAMLLAQPPRADDKDNPARIVGMSPVIPQVSEFMERFGIEGFTTAYGMTEIGAPINSGVNPPNIETCGRARPGYQLRVVNEHDEDVGPGKLGELIVRADEPWLITPGYFNMPEKTAEAWRNGWFHTGDGFTYDEDGWFYFKDRIKDAIRRRGENISSFEVEQYVQEHESVEDCAAVAAPSELTEDEVKIVVVRKSGCALTEEELVRFLIPRMPRFMVPRFVQFVEALPKTDASFRTKKAELRNAELGPDVWDRVKAGVEIPH